MCPENSYDDMWNPYEGNYTFSPSIVFDCFEDDEDGICNFLQIREVIYHDYRDENQQPAIRYILYEPRQRNIVSEQDQQQHRNINQGVMNQLIYNAYTAEISHYHNS